MSEYKVNANFLINVSVWVDADSEEEAEERGRQAILNKECEWQDPVKDPEIKFVELTEEEEEDDDWGDDSWFFDAGDGRPY